MSELKRTMNDVSTIKKVNDGVLIEVTETAVDPAKVEQVITNCKEGKCECMRPEVKSKVSDMVFVNDNGKISISIKGTVSEAEIKEALGGPSTCSVD